MKKNLFEPKNHIQNLSSKKYYMNLVLLRSTIEKECDNYFHKLGAPKVDLYLFSNSVSSPIALGSDSKAIDFHLDGKAYYLADSSQFGMEPLLINSFDMVYCYLPSFRGENPDNRHLNQFYHCEAEMRGDYGRAISTAENLVKHLTKSVIRGLERGNFRFAQIPNPSDLERICSNKFLRITFDDAIKLLENGGYGNLIEYKKFGRVLTSRAENMINKLINNNKLPIWVTNYDKDTVAFYQKPDPKDNTKALNADLLVPSLSKNGIGGEILGLGERQNQTKSIIESIKRQNINNKGQYDWYIKLRKNPKYRTTSGFGMGIERYISWILGLNSLADSSLYPVIKGAKTTY
jgi:aspartyl/asparaginyl-tRNA synthetase